MLAHISKTIVERLHSSLLPGVFNRLLSAAVLEPRDSFPAPIGRNLAPLRRTNGQNAAKMDSFLV